jgi:hypothetical protein
VGAAATTAGCSAAAAAAAAFGGRGGAAVLSRLEGGAVGRVGVPGTDDTTAPAPPQGSVSSRGLRCGKQGDLAGTGEPLLLDPSGDGRSMLGDGHGDEE